MSSTEPPKPPASATSAPAPAPSATAAAAAAATTTATTTTAKSKSSTTSKSKSKTATKAGGGTQAKAKKPARKKKPATKSSSTTSTQAILNNARAAQIDLAKQKAQAAARKSDPLWYRIEDVLPVVREANAMTGSPSVLPEQVQIVETALQLCGLTRADVTPQALACLLEQARRVAQELIANSQDYAHAASRAEITRADLLLAKEMRADHKIAISTQLPKLNLIAQHVNKVPLPPIPPQCYSGVLLPPKSHQLTARTYDIVSGAQVTQRKMVQKLPEAPHKKPTATASQTTASYGATRAGHQIPIKLKSTSTGTTAGASTTTTTATPPAAATAPTPATASSAPTPMDISSPTTADAAAAPAPTTMTGTAQPPGAAGTAATGAPGGPAASSSGGSGVPPKP